MPSVVRSRSGRAFFLLLSILLIFALSACMPRKSKTIVDRVYELDPYGRLYINPRLQINPPRSVAVLPFRSRVGAGRVEGSESLFMSFQGKGKASPSLVAHQMRLAFFGQLAQLPFELIHPNRVDEILKANGLRSWESVKALSPHQLGKLLHVDAVIFGEVTNFDYIYAILYTQVAAGLRVEMISTRTGETLWRFNDTRRNHTVRIALDPLSLAVGLFQAGFSLRSINLTRAMDEISREAVATLPAPLKQSCPPNLLLQGNSLLTQS